MKRFMDYVRESSLIDAKEKAFYSEIPPNKQKDMEDIACDLFRKLFPKYTKQCMEFLESFKYKDEFVASEIDTLKYELKLSDKDPKQDGLAYASTNL